MDTFLAQEGKESTANPPLLCLTALWLVHRCCAGNTVSGALGGKERSSTPPCELWVCLPRVMQGRADLFYLHATAVGSSENFLVSYVHYQFRLSFIFHGEWTSQRGKKHGKQDEQLMLCLGLQTKNLCFILTMTTSIEHCHPDVQKVIMKPM